VVIDRLCIIPSIRAFQYVLDDNHYCSSPMDLRCKEKPNDAEKRRKLNIPQRSLGFDSHSFIGIYTDIDVLRCTFSTLLWKEKTKKMMMI
jgi:hypothetical protein